MMATQNSNSAVTNHRRGKTPVTSVPSDLMRERRVCYTLFGACDDCALGVDELFCLVDLGHTRSTQLRL